MISNETYIYKGLGIEATDTEEPGTKRNPVVVIDAPCGAGKTSWAIDYMNQADGPFMFVTPFKKEINDRIVPALESKGFRAPEKKPSKGKHLLKLLSDHRNIACTHQLFRQIGNTALDLIQAAGYTLILDEVMQVLEPVPIGAKDRNMLFDTGVLELLEDGRTVRAANPADYLADNDNRFRDVVRTASHDRLTLVNDSMLLWLFPAKVFAAFHQIYNLTYLYEAQIQAAYYLLHGVEIAKKSVTKDPNTCSFQLVACQKEYDAEFRQQMSTKVALYQGKYNEIGRGHGRRKDTALSKGWFERTKNPVLASLGKTIRNYFLSRNTKADDVLWSVFGDWEKKIPVNGYAGGFLACNARASNEYKDRTVLAYCCNRYVNPMILQWFQDGGCAVEQKFFQEAFAASELVQWLCRSAIREEKPVSLFLPSKRMREIYQMYLDGKYS